MDKQPDVAFSEFKINVAKNNGLMINVGYTVRHNGRKSDFCLFSGISSIIRHSPKELIDIMSVITESRLSYGCSLRGLIIDNLNRMFCK